MKFEMMELKIYEEYKRKVESEHFNGKVVLEELKKGDYLKNMECSSLEPELFAKVAQKIKNEMEEGFTKEIGKAPFFVRSSLENAKYGESVFTVSINKNILRSVRKRINELQQELQKDQNKNSKLLNSISMMSNRQKSNVKDFEMGR